MASLNRVSIIGNLGRDAELRYTASGSARSEFSVAVNEKYQDKERTEWFNVVIWGKLAEAITEYLRKGTLVYVDGRQSTRTWTDDQGQKHYRTEVIGQTVQLLGSRNGGSGGGGQPQQARRPAPADEIDVDDLPFE